MTAPAPPQSSPAAPAPVPTASVFQMQEGDVRKLVDSTFRNARRLQKLTQSLLEVARIDSKRVVLELQTFDLNEKIRQVITDIKNLLDLEGKGVRTAYG